MTLCYLSSVLFEKEDTGAKLSLTTKFCKINDRDDCMVTLQVLDRAVLPLPICSPDGSMTFPDGMLVP